MNQKTIISLALLAVIAIVAAVAVKRHEAPLSEVAAGDAWLAPALRDHINDVRQVLIKGAGDKVLATLVRGDKGWTLAQKGGYAVDSGKLRELLLKLAEARLIEQKTGAADKYATLGVQDVAAADAKGVQIELDGLAQPFVLIIGDSNPRGGTYVRRAGEAQSWLTGASLTVDRDTANWLRKDLVSLPATRIASVTLTPGEGKPVRIEKQAADGADFHLLDVPKGREPGDAFTINAIAGVLDGLQLDDVMPAAEAPAPAPAAARKARFETVDGVVVELTGWDRDGKHFATLTAVLDDAAAAHAIDAAQAKVKVEYDKAVADASANEEGDKAGEAPLKPLAVTDPAKDRANRLAALGGEVAGMNARFGGWAFVLPAYKYANIDKSMADLLKPLEPATAAGKATPAKR